VRGLELTLPDAAAMLRACRFAAVARLARFRLSGAGVVVPNRRAWSPSQNRCGGVVQLVRTPACQAGGREFKSRRSRQVFANPAPQGRDSSLPDRARSTLANPSGLPLACEAVGTAPHPPPGRGLTIDRVALRRSPKGTHLPRRIPTRVTTFGPRLVASGPVYAYDFLQHRIPAETRTRTAYRRDIGTIEPNVHASLDFRGLSAGNP
jgi:hypothetical protein